MTMDAGWDLVNEDARAWASQYAGQLVAGITRTSATLLQGALADYISGKLTYKDMIAQLAPTFGSQRANTISITEVTRSFAAGSQIAAQRSGIGWLRVNTAQDERVCEICDSADGEIIPSDGDIPVPFHTRCRCWLSESVDGPS